MQIQTERLEVWSYLAGDPSATDKAQSSWHDVANADDTLIAQSTVEATIRNLGVQLHSELNVDAQAVSEPVTTICDISSKVSVISTKPV